MVECGSFESEGSSATWTIKDLPEKVKLDFRHFYDSTIRTYDETNQLFYVHVKRPDDKEDELNRELGKWSSEELWETDEDYIALYKTEQKLTRVYITKTPDANSDTFELFEIDSGRVHPKAHRSHLYKIPRGSILRTFKPQVVPVAYKEFSDGDYLSKTECMEHAQVSISLQKGDETDKAFRAETIKVYVSNNQQELIPSLKAHKEFKKYSVNRDGELTCCFAENGVCRSPPPPAKVTSDEGGLDHTLLTCIIAGSLICAIIIVTLAAIYLYRRFGHVISERHRRHHHGHRRHRKESQQGSDRGSPSSSQKRDPLAVPTEDSAPPPPSIPLPPPNENVITRMPQHNIVVSGSKEGANPNYTQVNRNINPLVMENSQSPNRAMTPLKTQEMSTQTHSMTRSEPVHDDDASSNRAQPSRSRMSAGSSTSDLSDATLRQPSLQSSRHSTRQSVCPPSLVSSSGFALPSHQSIVYRNRLSPPQTMTMQTHDDLLTTTGATMADDVGDSDEDDDEDSVTRSVDDCERVLAAYKPPSHSTPAPVSAHRTKSHLSTRPQLSSASHYTENETSRGGALPNRTTRPHLISLPDRSPRGEEKRRIEESGQPRSIESIHSVPLELLGPRTRSTNSDVQTAARRESTVSWLADSTQLSMGRSMYDDDVSL